MSESFLERHLSELSTGDQAVPLAYDKLRERARDALQRTSYDYIVAAAGKRGSTRTSSTVSRN